MVLNNKAEISAAGKHHQTFCNTPVKERRYATGIKTTSCLTKETIILVIPIPKAWKQDIKIIQIAATGK